MNTRCAFRMTSSFFCSLEVAIMLTFCGINSRLASISLAPSFPPCWTVKRVQVEDWTFRCASKAIVPLMASLSLFSVNFFFFCYGSIDDINFTIERYSRAHLNILKKYSGGDSISWLFGIFFIFPRDPIVAFIIPRAAGEEKRRKRKIAHMNRWELWHHWFIRLNLDFYENNQLMMSWDFLSSSTFFFFVELLFLGRVQATKECCDWFYTKASGKKRGDT